jgi:hypothetical protein
MNFEGFHTFTKSELIELGLAEMAEWLQQPEDETPVLQLTDADRRWLSALKIEA